MSGHSEDAEDAEDRERNAQRMRGCRRERGLEVAEEPDVLPRPATAVSQGDLYAGCRRGTFKQANVLTYEVETRNAGSTCTGPSKMATMAAQRGWCTPWWTTMVAVSHAAAA